MQQLTADAHDGDQSAQDTKVPRPSCEGETGGYYRRSASVALPRCCG